MTIDFNQAEIETLIELILDAAYVWGDPDELIAPYDKLKAALSEREEAK